MAIIRHMDMISEISLSYLRLFSFLVISILFHSCSYEEPAAPTFYFPKRVAIGHDIPVLAHLSKGNMLEQKKSIDFLDKQHDLTFRFRTSVFNYSLQVGDIIEELECSEIKVSNLNDTLTLQKNTIYKLDHPLYIGRSGVLIFEEGCQLYIDDGIDILNLGKIEVRGYSENPVLITASNNYWGGISSSGGKIVINHLIITRSGGNDTIKVRHSYSQPAIYMVKNGYFNASNLYIIKCKGKAMYIHNSIVKISKALFSECDTGPEINWSKVKIDSIICMNIPDAGEGEDDDNDALYIFGKHKNYPDYPPVLNNVLLGFAKDDGLDHGKNDMTVKNLLVYKIKDKAISLEGGHMRLTNTWLSDARVLIGVKQDTHAKLDSIYLSGFGIKTDILKHMNQDPTLEITNEFEITNKEKDSKQFWFPVF